ncbi:putative aminopeptidase [Helianthus debilis subsp. tardiflorus]
MKKKIDVLKLGVNLCEVILKKFVYINTNLLLLIYQKISFAAKETDLVEWKGDILAIGVTEKDMTKDKNLKFKNQILEKLDSKVNGLLSEVSGEEDFTGKAGQSTVIRVSGFGPKRVSLIGLGKGPTDPSSYRVLGESVASAAKASQANNVAVALASSEGLTPESKLATASAIAKDNMFKSEYKKPSLKCVDFFGLGGGPEFEKKLKYTEDICSGVILAKELVNAPANVLAEEAAKVAATYSDVFTAKILDTEQCKELKMGSYLGVAAASTNPPKFIHLCYKPPNGPIKTKLTLVGKGLTFDSGGYNIKTGLGSMDLMKCDMGGSAAVLGAAKALGQIKPPGVEVHFIVAACENMISGTSMRPGDILTASNGKTIEVSDTDAEGRLTLADALVYACNQGVDKIVDLATLTGACIVALGPSIAGIFTPSDELSNEVVAAAEVAGEKLWRLPMEESYWDSMKSGVADMVNAGSPKGDSITAALFLKQFVDEKVQWLHIDMAGPVWNNKKNAATGFAIPTLVEWVVSNS